MRQYDEGEHFVAPVEDVGRPRAARPGLAGARVAADPGRDPRPAAWISRVGPRPPSPAERGGRPVGRPAVADLLGRCTFPAAGCRRWPARSRAGADSLALLVLAVAAGCRVTAVHVDHGLRPGSAAEAEVVADAAAPVRRRLRGRAGGGGRRAQPRGPGPGGPARRAARTRPPGTPWTTRPRRSCSTCCAAPGSTGWPAWRRAAPSAARPPAARDARRSARPLGPRRRCATRATTTPLRAQPGPPRAAAAVRGRRRARPVPLLARQAGAAGRRRRAARRAGRALRPIPRTPGRPGRAPPAAGPPARPRQWLPAATATRRRSPPSSGSSRWPAAAVGHRGAGGSAGGAGPGAGSRCAAGGAGRPASGRTRPPPVESRR